MMATNKTATSTHRHVSLARFFCGLAGFISLLSISILNHSAWLEFQRH
jgi:hypothetical protein